MRLLFLILFSFLSSQAFAETQALTLKNGLKVIAQEDHRAPVVVSMIWYNVGSADEPGGITGISHALEHMMFKGTTKYPRGMFSKTIANLGGQENASTSQDYTMFYEKISASQLPICLELEADRMQNLLLDSEEFAREIKVIREERRMRTEDNPQALNYERFLAVAHLGSPYHHPVIGWMGDLKEMSIADIRAWYKHFYAPNNTVLVVVGDIKAEKVFRLANLYFGNIEKRPSFKRKTQAEPPLLGAKKINIHAPAQLPMLMFGYSVPSLMTAKDPWQPYALEIIGGILDAGESGRFTKNIIRGTRIAGGINAYYNLRSRYQTQFMIFGLPTPAHSLEELKAVALKEIQALKTQPMDLTELNRVKKQLIAQKIFEQDSIYGQAMELGLLETVGIGWEKANHYKANIEAITPEQIQTAAREFFIEKALTEAHLYPLESSKQQEQ